MKKTLFILYNLTITTLFALASVVSARSLFGFVSALIYLPLIFYFFKELAHASHLFSRLPLLFPAKPIAPIKASAKAAPFPISKEQLATVPVPERGRVMDTDRRLFLKLIGSAGISVFMLALFTKKAQAAFFGSVPGPGVIALKDVAGNKIDPAEKYPTSGYGFSQLEEGATYSYFGFVNKAGAWYIQRETVATGDYRYTKGSSDFATGWTNRATPTIAYNYFNVIFG